MDYFGILKRAWNATWNHKILWLFGLFAGVGTSFSGGNGFNSNNLNSNSGNNPLAGQSGQALAEQFQRFLPLIIVAGVLLLVIGLAWFVLSIAARGGIIYLVNEAEESREVRGGAGWRAGFSKWWRIFGVQFLAGLPVLLILLVMLVAVGLSIAGAVSQGLFSSGAANAGSQAAGAVVTALVGICLVVVVLVIALIVVGVIFGIVERLALNYAILEDRRVIESLKQGWRDLWGKRGAFVMFLMMTLVSIVVGIALGLVAIVLLLPGILSLVAQQWVVGGVLVALALLILVVPGAIWAAFYHAAWTIFFRRMTGREALPAAVPAAGGAYVPVPPVPPAPPSVPETPAFEAPAPPMPPEPPAPPAPGL